MTIVGILWAAPLSAAPVLQSSTTFAPASVTIVHPTEGQRLPGLSQVFIEGAVTVGSSLTVNGVPISVHPKGGYLAMVNVSTGDFVLHAEAKGPAGDTATLDRHVWIAPPFAPSPATPTTIEKGSVAPFEDAWLAPGDQLRITFQGSPGGTAEFSIDGVAKHLPMLELGGRGIYEGVYIFQPTDKTDRASVEVQLKKGSGRNATVKMKAAGHVTVSSGATPRIGQVLDEIAAVRTAPDGGYDLFLYKGMRVRLTGKIGTQWRVRLSATQSGWVKDSAIQELPAATLPVQTQVTNLTVSHQDDSTILRVPLSDALPFRTEQSLEPTQLIVTLYGAVDKTDLIRYDPQDSVIRQVRWRQAGPDSVQLVIEPQFKKWWGYDVRYEGSTLIVEIRKPWKREDLDGLIVAVDPGHGGQDTGATGPHGTYEKDANLLIARTVRDALEKAGAKPFLTRDKDVDVALYDRPRIAWNHNARIFVSIHCNAAGEWENPVWNNGYSIYWYQPQSQELANKIHAGYAKQLTIPDHGLYFADFAVCRLTQMPSVLTEQAFIIVPEQEQLIFDPKFQKQLATAIVNGLRAYLAKQP